MNKKAIAILGGIFLLIVGTLGFLIYTKYGKKDESKAPVSTTSSSTPQSSSTITTTISDPDPSTQTPSGYKPVQLTADRVISPALYFQGNGIVYFDASGNLIRGDLSTSTSPMVYSNQKSIKIQQKSNISRILWPSPKDGEVSKDFIAEFSISGRKTWSYYNADKGTYTDLPSQVISVDWLPGGYQVMFVWLENDVATLNIGNPDTTNWKQIDKFYESDNAISVSPDGKNIAFHRQFNSDAVNPINYVSFDGQIWKSLIKDGYNYGILWSPDSKKFLFAQKEKNTQKYQIWYYDMETGNAKSLGLPTTVEKAVWGKNSDVVYLAVPNSGTAGEMLTTDDFYKVDLQTFDKKKFAIDGSAVDGRNLFLTLEEDRLIFKNAQDNGLYYIDVSK